MRYTVRRAPTRRTRSSACSCPDLPGYRHLVASVRLSRSVFRGSRAAARDRAYRALVERDGTVWEVLDGHDRRLACPVGSGSTSPTRACWSAILVDLFEPLPESASAEARGGARATSPTAATRPRNRFLRQAMSPMGRKKEKSTPMGTRPAVRGDDHDVHRGAGSRYEAPAARFSGRGVRRGTHHRGHQHREGDQLDAHGPPRPGDGRAASARAAPGPHPVLAGRSPALRLLLGPRCWLGGGPGETLLPLTIRPAGRSREEHHDPDRRRCRAAAYELSAPPGSPARSLAVIAAGKTTSSPVPLNGAATWPPRRTPARVARFQGMNVEATRGDPEERSSTGRAAGSGRSRGRTPRRSGGGPDGRPGAAAALLSHGREEQPSKAGAAHLGARSGTSRPGKPGSRRNRPAELGRPGEQWSVAHRLHRAEAGVPGGQPGTET